MPHFSVDATDAALAADVARAGFVVSRTSADAALAADLTRGSTGVARDAAIATDAAQRAPRVGPTTSDGCIATDVAASNVVLKRGTADAAVSTAATTVAIAVPRTTGDTAMASDLAWTSFITRDGTGSTTAKAPVLAMSWNHTIGSGPLANNRLLVVVLDVLSTHGQQATTVTYGGVPLARVVVAGSAPARAEMWVLVAPASGTATVVATFTAPVSGVGGSISFFSVRQGVPVRSSTAAIGFGSEIVPPTTDMASQGGDLSVDAVAITEGSMLKAGPNQQAWLDLAFTALTGASSYAGGLPLEWTAWPPASWAYAGIVLEPLLRAVALANDSALSADSVLTLPFLRSRQATDSAATSDSATAGVVLIPGSINTRSGLLGQGALGEQLLGGRTTQIAGGALDFALTSDVATNNVVLQRRAADTANAFDSVGQLAPIGALVTTSGVFGHMVFGWWVLGMRDTYERGRLPLDSAVSVDSGAITAVLFPRGAHDTALAWAAATRSEVIPRPTPDHALTTDAVSPFRFSTGIAADTAATTDAAARQAHLAARATDQALDVDEAHRLAPQPGHSYDGAYTDDLAAQRRGHVTPTADTSLTSDVASGRPGVGATDNAITSDRVTHTNLYRVTAVDASTSVDHGTVVGGPAATASDTSTATDHATASRFRAAIDAAATTDKATGIVGPSATAADAAATTDAASAFRGLRAGGADSSVTVDHAQAGHPLARATADTCTTTDSPTRGSSGSVADTATAGDTAAAGRPSVRVTHDVCALTDAGAWTRFAPRSTTDTVLSTDGAMAMLGVSATDVALTFETAHIATRLGAIAVDSAPAFDRIRTYVLVRPRMIGFGKAQPQWRFGKVVTTTNRPAAFDYAGRP